MNHPKFIVSNKVEESIKGLKYDFERLSGPCLESHRGHCIVSLSKILYLDSLTKLDFVDIPQEFSYLSGPVNLEKKHLDPQSWENLMKSKELDSNFKSIKKHGYKKLA